MHEGRPVAHKILILVTCGSAKEARHIARAMVERRLAACVSMIAFPVESLYRWKGKVESAQEFLLLIKTTAAQFPLVRDAVKRMHAYDVPEIIALSIAHGSKDYLSWISESVRPEARNKTRKRKR
jgi:periplasmic divalent cation tolerance protein